MRRIDRADLDALIFGGPAIEGTLNDQGCDRHE
jgi:hypothetical protein